jgi:hypothetical protein
LIELVAGLQTQKSGNWLSVALSGYGIIYSMEVSVASELVIVTYASAAGLPLSVPTADND